jgi:hypothetical protein
MIAEGLSTCPDGGIGRHKGLKIPRTERSVPVRVRLRAPGCERGLDAVFPLTYALL